MSNENTFGQKSKLYQLLFTLGNSYLERQQFSEAYDKLSQLLELEPDNPEVLELTAKAAIKIKKVTDEALDLYEKTLEKHTNPRQFIDELATLFEGNKINTAFSNEVLQKAKQLENVNGKEADLEPAEAEQFISNNQSVRGNLEQMWRKNNFQEAVDYLQSKTSDSTDIFKTELALAHAYQHLSQNKIIRNHQIVSLILNCINSYTPPYSLATLRDLLTLYLPLPRVLKMQGEESPECKEYKFILGMIPMEEFFAEIQDTVTQSPPIETFNLKTNILDNLDKAEEWEESKEDLSQSWTSFLFAQIFSVNNTAIPRKIINLVNSYLYKIPRSVLRNTESGFLNLAVEPLEQIKAVIKLYKSIESYNVAVTHNYHIFFNCSITIASDAQKKKKNNDYILNCLVRSAQLLCSIDLTNSINNSGTFYIEINKSLLKEIKNQGYNYNRVKDQQLLPGVKSTYIEILTKKEQSGDNFPAPKTIGDIDLKDCLKKHNIYSTYLGKNKHLERKVIVKILPLKKTDSTFDKDSALNNIRKIGRMNHPYIATLFDMGEDKDLLYFTREYVEGKNILDFDFSKPEWELDLIGLLQKIIRALVYADSQGLPHNNLKPANIWLNDSQGIKLTDFQFITIGQDKDHHSAPEVLKNGKGDSRSDIYSLGLIMYQLLCGELPFAENLTKQEEIINIDFSLPHNEKMTYHENWNSIILKATQKNPAERYQTLQEFSTDLNELQLELIPAEPSPDSHN